MTKTEKLKPGIPVKWSTSQGATEGVVLSKVTSSTKIKNYTAKATPAQPQFKVRTKKSGKVAVHKAAALSKR